MNWHLPARKGEDGSRKMGNRHGVFGAEGGLSVGEIEGY